MIGFRRETLDIFEIFWYLLPVLKLYVRRVPPSRVSTPHRDLASPYRDLASPHRDLDVHPSRFERWMMKRSRASQHE